MPSSALSLARYLLFYYLLAINLQEQVNFGLAENKPNPAWAGDVAELGNVAKLASSGELEGWLEKAEIKPTQPSWILILAELGNIELNHLMLLRGRFKIKNTIICRKSP